MASQDGTSASDAGQVKSQSGGGIARSDPAAEGEGAARSALAEGAPEARSTGILDSKSVKRDKGGFSRRLSKLGSAKAESDRLANWAIAQGLPARVKRANDQKECGAWLWFRRVLSGDLSGETFLHRAYFCQQMTCPLCARRKAYVTANVYLPKLMALWAAKQPGREAHFITLTQRHRDESAGESWDRFDEKLKRLTDRLRQQRNRKRGRLANVVGGLGHIETKRGKGSGSWHPHYHGLWFFDGRPSYSALQKAWGEGCYFKPLNTQQHLIDGVKFRDAQHLAESVRHDLKEIIKYPLKFEPGCEADIWDVAETLHARRKLRPFGKLIKVDVPEDLCDNVDIDWEAEEWTELAYCWSKAGYVLHAGGKGDQTQSRRVASFDAWNDGHAQ